MKTLAFMEVANGHLQGSSLEIIALAQEVGDASLVLVGEEAAQHVDEVSCYGIPTIVVKAKADSQDAVVAVLDELVRDQEFGAVFFCANTLGRDLAPRLAARLHGGVISDVIENVRELKAFVRPAYGGTVLETYKFSGFGGVKVITVRAGIYPRPEKAAAPGAVTEWSYEVPDELIRVHLKEVVTEITEKIDLEGAQVVVSGGRGMGSKEGFAMVEELAKLLGGEVGATRAAVDEGWTTRAHQVGQSGKNVAPKLYIACGISGAMQHVSGITSSDFILAINKDEEAPIFDVADLAVVGRCEDILPLMIEEIKKKKA